MSVYLRNIILGLCSILVLLSSCGGGWGRSAEDVVRISTTIPPTAALIQEMGGDEVKVQTLLPRGSSPEHYEPSMLDVVDLSGAQVYMYVGDLPFERKWVHRIRNLNAMMKMINLSDSVPLSDKDPHYWMSVSGIRLMQDAILHGLERIKELDHEAIQQRYEEMRERLDKLEAELRTKLETRLSDAFIIFHPALTEYARDFGLKQIVIEEDGKEPTPSHIREVIDRGRASGVKVVFVQEEFDARLAIEIARELQATVVNIAPLDARWEDQLRLITTALSERINYAN